MHQQPNPAAKPTPPPRILLVDDIAAMRVAVRGLLEDAGLPVIGEAADGLQAVTMAADLQPDIVVMDVRMPGLDGLAATKRITGAHPHIRVVVYSVFDSGQTQYAARRRALPRPAQGPLLGACRAPPSDQEASHQAQEEAEQDRESHLSGPPSAPSAADLGRRPTGTPPG